MKGKGNIIKEFIESMIERNSFMLASLPQLTTTKWTIDMLGIWSLFFNRNIRITEWSSLMTSPLTKHRASSLGISNGGMLLHRKLFSSKVSSIGLLLKIYTTEFINIAISVKCRSLLMETIRLLGHRSSNCTMLYISRKNCTLFGRITSVMTQKILQSR